MAAPLLDRTLIYVTGKGGVGRTTVAASIGIAAARRGRRTIVCEVAEQQRVAHAFAAAGVGSEGEQQLAENLWAITIDPAEALREWLAGQLGRTAVRVVTGSTAFGHFVAAAPGAKELITIAKIWELAQPERKDPEHRTYDTVIVDAPASGHGLALLGAPSTFEEVARVGPIRRQAGKVRALLADPQRTGYVAVALAEEMPVAETLEFEPRLAATIGRELDLIVVNAVLPERLRETDATKLRSALGTPAGPAEPAGDSARSSHGPAEPLSDDPRSSRGPAEPARGPAEPSGATLTRPAERAAVVAALSEHDRVTAQRAHLRRLRRAAKAPVRTLPFLFSATVGTEAYATLARRLEPALTAE